MSLMIGGYSPVTGVSAVYPQQYVRATGEDAANTGRTGALAGEDTTKKNSKGIAIEEDKKRTGTEECQTCKNRKYQDGSNEMVSFKSAAHIPAAAAASVVRSHEQEHVTNAYAKATTGNGKVINASVTLHTAICPECGRSYISGGTTQTQIKYYNEENPYQQDLKSADRARLSGMNVNYAV